MEPWSKQLKFIKTAQPHTGQSSLTGHQLRAMAIVMKCEDRQNRKCWHRELAQLGSLPGVSLGGGPTFPQ